MGGMKANAAEHQVRVQTPYQGHERAPSHTCIPWGCSPILTAPGAGPGIPMLASAEMPHKETPSKISRRAPSQQREDLITGVITDVLQGHFLLTVTCCSQCLRTMCCGSLVSSVWREPVDCPEPLPQVQCRLSTLCGLSTLAPGPAG